MERSGCDPVGHLHSPGLPAITLRTRRFHDGNALSSGPTGQSNASHNPRATPGDRLTPNSQWTTIRSVCGHCRTNRKISSACGAAKRTSSSAGAAMMSLKVRRRIAAKLPESFAGLALGSPIEMQTSTPRGSYRSAASRESTRSSMHLFTGYASDAILRDSVSVKACPAARPRRC